MWLAVSLPTLLLLAGTAREISVQTSREFSLQPPPHTEDGEAAHKRVHRLPETRRQITSRSHKTIRINPQERRQTRAKVLEEARSCASPAQTHSEASSSPSTAKLEKKSTAQAIGYAKVLERTTSHRESNQSNFRHLLNTVWTHLSLAALEIAEHSSF